MKSHAGCSWNVPGREILTEPANQAPTAIDHHVRRPYSVPLQTVVDVDEKLLSLAGQRARRDGMSLGALVEDALRAALHIPPSPTTTCADEVEAVDGDAACCASLEEVRALGRVLRAHRQVELS